MMDIEARLASCFTAVLPEMGADEIRNASAAGTVGWDSVTMVTLLAVIEDEFQIAVDLDDPARFDSFQGILEYLRRQIGVGDAAGELV
jgi:acyl carrier protein